jgi:hypothetical protein
VEVIFGSKVTRGKPGTFSTRLLNRGDQVTVNLSFKHLRVKIYLKEDRALRGETVVNDPGDLGCKRSLEHLDELAAKARACNARLMDAVIAGQGSGILANPVIERIAHPTVDAAGRRSRPCASGPLGAGPGRLPGHLGPRRLRHHQQGLSILSHIVLILIQACAHLGDKCQRVG